MRSRSRRFLQQRNKTTIKKRLRIPEGTFSLGGQHGQARVGVCYKQCTVSTPALSEVKAIAFELSAVALRTVAEACLR